MAEELKACPFCGGAVRFHSDEDCHGCHYIECGGCKAMFDFSPTTDPENQCDTMHELQCGIAHTWNTRAQLPSQGGEAVEVVAWLKSDGDGAWSSGEKRYMEHCSGNYSRHTATFYSVPLMTVAQHQRILAAATHPADQGADDLTMVKVSRELLQDLRDLAFDQVEHHRAAMGEYKQTRQSAMDSVLAQAEALLAKPCQHIPLTSQYGTWCELCETKLG